LKKHGFDVTLVEPKEYFEYTPGVVHLLAGSKGDLISPLATLALASGAERVLHGNFVGLDTVSKRVAIALEGLGGSGRNTINEELLPYDAAIICSGVPYTAPIRQDVHVTKPTFENRLDEIDRYAERLANSSHVIVAGGGLVGVELAAELSVRLDGKIKEVTLISRSSLLATLPEPAGRYASSWLKRRKNVNLLIEDEIVTYEGAAAADGGLYTTKSGKQLRADMYIDCTGSRIKLSSSSSSSSASTPAASVLPPATTVSTKYQGGLLSPFNVRGLVNVDECFRAVDCPEAGALFAVGDVVEHSTGGGVGFAATTSMAPFGALRERPTVRNAHLAESQAEICAHNVAAFLTARQGTDASGSALPRLLRYPQDEFGTSLCPLLSCVSLGPRCGIVVFNDLVLGGLLFGMLGAVAKYVVERTKVAEIRNQLWGRAFWAFSHVVVNAIHALYVAFKRFNPLKSIDRLVTSFSKKESTPYVQPQS
jgi:NADH dehydrogenase FAD-containing subunit